MDPKEQLEQQAIERLAKDNPTTADVAGGLRVVINRLWSKKDLAEFITNTHNALCVTCPKMSGEKDKKWLARLVTTLIGLLGMVIGYFYK